VSADNTYLGEDEGREMADFQMVSFYTEAMKVVGTVTLGGLAGVYLQRHKDRAQVEKENIERWSKERQYSWSPLLEAAEDFRTRLIDLKQTYVANLRNNISLRDWYPGDFCELYVLDRTQINKLDENLEAADPISPRKNAEDVERTKVRTVHQLNYAASSIYMTAKYLGTAERALRGLYEFKIMLPDRARPKVKQLILNVRATLQGKGGAGIFTEQQEAIGEIVRDSSDRIITNFEFRKWMFDPGWEQFTGLFRFYVHFHKKLDSEVKNTIDALEPLIAELERLTNTATFKEYDLIWSTPLRTNFGWLSQVRRLKASYSAR
jgi:hypothetical protein